MLRNTNDLDNFSIRATDGELGHIKDLYFDDDAWVLRYFIVETGTWLSSRKVLITPLSALRPDWEGKVLPVSITRKQVTQSPEFDTDKPVSRQNEESYMAYYGYPYYWGGTGLWGDYMTPYAMGPAVNGHREDWTQRQRDEESAIAAERERHRNDNPHLRSCEAVRGYHVKANDGEIGHIDSYLLDEITWAIRYLVVSTSNWWGGHKVLVAPPWITGVNWSEQTVSVALSRADIQASPAYNSGELLDRAWERVLHKHYGRTGYWSSAGQDSVIYPNIEHTS